MRTIHLVAVLLTLAMALPLPAQDTAALISEQMDRLVELDVNDTLPAAMEAISEKTGVPLEAHPAVWETLPWGEQTNVKAVIKNQTLRQALEAITQSLGLTFEVKDQGVELQPVPALRRLGKRATVKELEALKILRSTRLESKTEHPTIGQILEGVDAKLAAAKAEFAIENRALEGLDLKQTAFVPRGASLADALEALANDTRATWYPWGQAVVIIGKQEQISMQLDKTINARFSGVDVTQVLIDLASKSGVEFTIEPGAIQRMPASARTIERLIVPDLPARQALEAIAAVTGLNYVVTDRGVHLSYNPTDTAQRDPTIGIITLPSGLRVPLRESQVPADLRQYIEHKTRQELDKLRTMMEEENFQPQDETKALN